MKTVQEVIVVEGRYDKNTVSQVVSGTIIETRGFGVFSDKEKIALLRKLAEKRGLIILTDNDGAGFFIRRRLRGVLGDKNIKHAYIPDVTGRERRKSHDSKDGLIGVEGMEPEIIVTALERAGATFDNAPAARPAEALITKTDLYFLGLSGCANSAQKRSELLERLDLPKRLPVNSIPDILNVLYSRDEFLALF